MQQGLLLEGNIPGTPISFGFEGSWNWGSGTASGAGLALLNYQLGELNIGAVNVGALADTSGNVGGYLGTGVFGLGGYVGISLFGSGK